MNTYPDLHDHIRAVEEKGLLMRVTRVINKDTEMHPLVRWQFRGRIPESQRRAFLFENVTDSKGRRFDTPVAVGILASNRAIYSTGIGCDVLRIFECGGQRDSVSAPLRLRVPICRRTLDAVDYGR